MRPIDTTLRACAVAAALILSPACGGATSPDEQELTAEASLRGCAGAGETKVVARAPLEPPQAR